MELQTWYDKQYRPEKQGDRVFLTEFCIHESLPIYFGRVGILSGDHLKSAGDMGLPLVCVGPFTGRDIFKQYLNFDGWQQEEYVKIIFQECPFQRVKDANGQQLKISV